MASELLDLLVNYLRTQSKDSTSSVDDKDLKADGNKTRSGVSC